MWAFVMALGMLMWMWSSMSVHVLRRLLAGRQDTVLLAGLVAMIGGGLVVLLLLPYFILPASALSLTWTRESLMATQQYSFIVLLLVGVTGFLRAQGLLMPAALRPGSFKSAGGLQEKLQQKKRRS